MALLTKALFYVFVCVIHNLHFPYQPWYNYGAYVLFIPLFLQVSVAWWCVVWCSTNVHLLTMVFISSHSRSPIPSFVSFASPHK